MNSEVMHYHWDNREKLYADYQYLQGLYERLLRDLAKQLNEIHGVNHSLRYWRILVGVWLGYFTQVLFDRWTCIQQAANEYEAASTIVLTNGCQSSLVPNDLDGFNRLFHDDYWNHHIYAEILRGYTQISCTRRQSNAEPSAGLRPDLTPVKSPLRGLLEQTILALYRRLSSSLLRSTDVLIASTYLGHLNEIRLQWRLGQIPQIYGFVKPVRKELDSTRRKWSLEGESRSMFENFVRNIVPKQIPIVYLEGYQALMKQADSQNWPKQPKLIWTSNAFSSDEVFKAAAATMTDSGTPLIIGQHGGHYGVGRWNFSEEHELAISDCYLSWGWTDPKHRNIKPIGILKPRNSSKRTNIAPHRATLVTTTLQRYSGPMISSYMSSQYLGYLQDMFTFVAQLPEAIRRQLTVRLYSHDEGWNQAERWRENCEDVSLDSGHSRIGTLMAESKIYICTYNATAHLESLSMGVPTVMFWNPDHWELRDSAIPYFENLKAVGIFHESPITAARHCEAVWDDVESWWQSVEVQSAIQSFCHRYARRPIDLLDQTEAAIRDTISGVQGRRTDAVRIE